MTFVRLVVGAIVLGAEALVAIERTGFEASMDTPSRVGRRRTRLTLTHVAGVRRNPENTQPKCDRCVLELAIACLLVSCVEICEMAPQAGLEPATLRLTEAAPKIDRMR